MVRTSCRLSLIAFFALSGSVLAKSQTVVIRQGEDIIELPLPAGSRVGASEGRIFVDRPGDGADERLLDLRNQLSDGASLSANHQGRWEVKLRQQIKVGIIDGENNRIDYPLDSVGSELFATASFDQWRMRDNELIVRLDDPVQSSALVINAALRSQQQRIDRLSISLQDRDAGAAKLELDRADFSELYSALDGSLPGEKFEPTRAYLKDELSRASSSIERGDLERAQGFFDSFLRYFRSAPAKVASFDVRSETQGVRVELFSILDDTPRVQTYTNGEMNAVVPGSYSLIAQKSGFLDSEPLKLDLFLQTVKRIDCSMAKPQAGTSVCRATFGGH